MGVGNSLFLDKTYACLLGGLIGDAMGAPVENKTYSEIIEQYGEVNDFEGEGTDDSAVKLILCQAIIENNGYITADEFAEFFMKNKEKYDLLWVPVRNMFHKIESKMCVPVDAGLGNLQSSSSAMAISPMGIINACNPRQAALETYDVAGLIHSGVTSFCRDAACAMAAAVAEAMNPSATIQSVLDASTQYLHKTSSALMIDLIKDTLNMAKESKDYEDFRQKFYESGKLQVVICDSRETVPCALALFYLAQGDPTRSIIYGANFGRDADTIASMVGALSGAFKGISGLKQEWIKKVQAGKSTQIQLAEKLSTVAQKRIQQYKDTIHIFEQLF